MSENSDYFFDRPPVSNNGDYVGTPVEVTGFGSGWMDFAVCKGRTHLFFPHYAERYQAKDRREDKAKELCASCPVIEPCRDFARSNNEYGFWAGENEEDRHILAGSIVLGLSQKVRKKRKKHLEDNPSG